MFINVGWKDPPELSMFRRKTSTSALDRAVERLLLVNPHCPVRIMLEFIRNKCKLGSYTEFDLCDESGGLLGLFNLPTYMYAQELFVHKRTYYVIALKTEGEKQVTILPQLNADNPLHEVLHDRVKKYLTTGDVTPMVTPPTGNKGSGGQKHKKTSKSAASS